MMFCIIYVFTMTRDTKDTLIVSYCGKPIRSIPNDGLLSSPTPCTRSLTETRSLL